MLCLGAVTFAAIAPVHANSRKSAKAQDVFSQSPRTELIKRRDAQHEQDQFPVRVNGYYGMMNPQGDLVVDPQFDWAERSFNSLTRVVYEGKTGFVGGNGDWVMPPTFDYIDRYTEDYAIVKDRDRIGFVDLRGKSITRKRLPFDAALRFKDGFAAVASRGKIGFINVAGDYAIKPQFQSARSFHDDLAAVEFPHPSDGDRSIWGFILTNGKIAFVDETENITALGDFSEDYAAYQVDGKWGFLDKRFKIAIKAQFDEVRDFVGTLAAVRVGEKWGYINVDGSLVIQPQFDKADDFDDVTALVQVDGLWGYINRRGRFMVEPQFIDARPFENNFAAVIHETEGWAYIDITGNLIWDPRLAQRGFIDLSNDNLRRQNGNRSGAFRNELVPPPTPARTPQPDAYLPEHLYEELITTKN